eukprot:Gb_14795 [translate_table: standard]
MIIVACVNLASFVCTNGQTNTAFVCKQMYEHYLGLQTDEQELFELQTILLQMTIVVVNSLQKSPANISLNTTFERPRSIKFSNLSALPPRKFLLLLLWNKPFEFWNYNLVFCENFF